MSLKKWKNGYDNSHKNISQKQILPYVMKHSQTLILVH